MNSDERPTGKPYAGRNLTVTYDVTRCLEAAECVRGLPRVFDTSSRPWIRPDGADPEIVADVVRRCPSGALQYRFTDGPDEEGLQPTVIVRSPAGRLYVRGRSVLRGEAGAVSETRAILCACGASGHQPYCDASGPCRNESLRQYSAAVSQSLSGDVPNQGAAGEPSRVS